MNRARMNNIFKKHETEPSENQHKADRQLKLAIFVMSRTNIQQSQDEKMYDYRLNSGLEVEVYEGEQRNHRLLQNENNV